MITFKTDAKNKSAILFLSNKEPNTHLIIKDIGLKLSFHYNDIAQIKIKDINNIPNIDFSILKLYVYPSSLMMVKHICQHIYKEKKKYEKSIAK